jgi:hypothetical protein
MAAFQIRLARSARGIDSSLAVPGRGRWLELIPETATRSKQVKNIPGRLQNYVTYDTLPETYILVRLL